jgi:hypothetical protein
VPFLIVESDWRATISPFTPTFSPNTFNQNFEITVLFNVVLISRNLVFGDNSPPTALKARVLSFALECKVFLERVVGGTSKRVHSIGN